MPTICSSIRQGRVPEGPLERFPQSAPGCEGFARAQFVQRCAAAHAQHSLGRQRSILDGLGCTRAQQTRPREEVNQRPAGLRPPQV